MFSQASVSHSVQGVWGVHALSQVPSKWQGMSRRVLAPWTCNLVGVEIPPGIEI